MLPPILIVENDRDSGDLYAFVLESCGARVITTSSVKDGLASLDRLMPRVLICGMRFPGESLYPLVHRVNYLGFKHRCVIPILITSTCSIAEFRLLDKFNTEAYLLKPVNLENFVDEVWNLTQGQEFPNSTGSIKTLEKN